MATRETRPRITVELSFHERGDREWINATLWGVEAGRHASQAVIHVPLDQEMEPIRDPEELLCVLADALHSAVVHL